MIIEDIKDQLFVLSKRWMDKIEETEQFQKIQERFQLLPPQIQKILLFIISGTAALLIFLIPYSSFQDSELSLEEFQSHRQIIRSLNQLKGTKSVSTLFPQPPEIENLKSNIEGQLSGSNLVKNIQGPFFVNSSPEEAGTLIPSSRIQSVLIVQLKKLNLKQVIDAGFKLQNLHASVRLKDLMLKTNVEDPRYLDASFEVFTFNVPDLNPPNSGVSE